LEISLLRTALLVLAIAAIPSLASAQTENYPTKPVRIIVPFPPGGSVDVIARFFSPKLSENLGQQVIVDNRSGASGNIGAELAARAAPDGYTVMMHTIPFVTNTFLYSRVPYDVLGDFVPVSLVSSSPVLLVVHPSVPARSVRELVQLAKSKPGALNYASAGAGTNHHIAGELLNSLAKIEIVVVHFKGGGPAMIANLGGEIGINYPNIAGAAPYVSSKRLRALGVTSSKRSPVMPDVPTIAEGGVPGYEFITWHGMLAPKATSAAIVTLLNDNLRKTMRSPDVVQRFQQEGIDIIASTPDQFGAFLKTELTKWSKVVKDRNMKAD
jgi:tripartite-type tricarboxylate transporter receptor subunit TctC